MLPFELNVDLFPYVVTWWVNNETNGVCLVDGLEFDNVVNGVILVDGCKVITGTCNGIYVISNLSLKQKNYYSLK